MSILVSNNKRIIMKVLVMLLVAHILCMATTPCVEAASNNKDKAPEGPAKTGMPLYRVRTPAPSKHKK